MALGNRLNILDQVSSLCDDKSSLQARLALASYSNHSCSSPMIEKGLMLFEYLQLVSPLLIATLMLNFNKDSALFQAFFLIARLINPAYWMSFDKTGALENTLLIFVCFFTVAKLLLLFYIMHRCARETEVSGKLVTIWRTVMKFQSRVAYFYVSSFYVAAIRVVNWETYDNTINQSIAFQMVSYILIILELLLALVPKICYHHMLPTKNFLSAKENTIEILTLVQKVITQSLTGGLNSSIPGFNWILASANIFIDIFRITNFFIRLPLYHLKSLYFQGWLLMMVASLNLSYFISLIFKESDSSFHSIGYSLIVWGILLCFGSIISNNLLKKAFWRLICDPSLDSPNLLFHRVVAIKELQKSTRMNCDQNHDFDILVWKTLNSHIKRILWADKGINDLDNKKNSNILFKNFLEKLQGKLPNNQYVQIFLAEFYFKRMKVYGDAIKICLNLQKSHSRKIKINAEILLIRIQNRIKDKTLDHSQHLNLLSFVSEHTFVAKLKQDMLKQTDLQIKICSEVMKHSPNLEVIYKNSQNAHINQQIITKKISQISTKISDYNIESLRIIAEYSLFLNHSVTDYIYFSKLSSQKLKKYHKLFAQEKLCPENIFQENTGFLKVSGAKGEAGKIIHATKQIENILGGDQSQYPGIYLPQRTPPILRHIFLERWKHLSENPETSAFGKINRSFFFHIDGYVVEIEYFIDIHPFTTQGFNFVFVFRPVVSNRQYLLLHENGDIDSSSKGLIEKLGIKPQEKRINIGYLNEELVEVNEAFNITAFPQKYALEEAKEIYSKYTTEGVDLSIKSQHNPALSYSYNCKMRNLVIGSHLIKILTLEENRTNEQLFQCLTSKRKASENVISEEETTQRNGEYLSDTQRNCLNSTERHLMTPTPRTKKRNNSRLFHQTFQRFDDNNENNQVPFSSSEISDEEEVIDRKTNNPQNLDQRSQEKKISHLFQMSLDSKSSSKTFRSLTFGFYTSLMIILLLRIFLKMISADYMNSLVAKKDIFSNNGYRSFLMIETAGLARYVWQFTSGALNLSDYPADFAQSLEITKSYALSNIQDLREVNKILLKASGLLSKEEHAVVFQKNVKIYNTYFDAPVQNFILMDSLQATDQIIEAALAVYSSFFDSVLNPEMTARAQFLFRNSMNDLILMNSQLSNRMLDSFDDQFHDLQVLSIVFMVIFIAILFVLTAVVIFYLYKQYSSDVHFISAVSKFNHSKIQAIHKALINFQNYLKQENSVEEIDQAQSYQNSKTREEEANLSRRETVKTPNHQDLRKRYLKHAFWITIVLIILIVLLILNTFIVNTRLNQIKFAQEKIYFINQIRIKMSLASTTFRELAATNNTALIYNKEALVELEFLIEQLVAIRAEIYSTLLTEEIVKDNPEVKTLLLGDGCSLLGSAFDSNCEVLKGNGFKGGFIYLINEFEDYLREEVETYKQSDKSAEALAELQTKDYRLRAIIYVVSLNEITVLWTKMNDFFISKIEDDQSGRYLSLSFFFVGAIIVGILGWRYLLKGLGQSVNQLKNILRGFPAGLVLSNFTLKAFLMKNSKVGLEHVRNEI